MDSFGEGKDADKKRQAVKNAMIAKRLVGPKHKRSLNKFLFKVKQSGGTNIPPKWLNEGRPELVSLPELRVIAAHMRMKHGHTHTMPVFMEMVTKHLKAKYQAEGKGTFWVDITPCTRTIQHMMTLLATLGEQEILDFAPQRKTNTRYTAENSLMSAMAFGATVAATGTHSCDAYRYYGSCGRNDCAVHKKKCNELDGGTFEIKIAQSTFLVVCGYRLKLCLTCGTLLSRVALRKIFISSIIYLRTENDYYVDGHSPNGYAIQ
jgi:hypothetical protein